MRSLFAALSAVALLVSTCAAPVAFAQQVGPSKKGISDALLMLGIGSGAVVPLDGKNWKLKNVHVDQRKDGAYVITFGVDPQ